MRPTIEILEFHDPPQAETPALPPAHLGRRYRLECEPGATAGHGIVGGYRISPQRAELLPPTPGGAPGDVFVWDPDAALPAGARLLDGDDRPLDGERLRGNSLHVADDALDGPELIAGDGASLLRMAPGFSLAFRSDAHAATLGVVNLVQAQRFISLADGERIVLLDTHDTEEPALYLEGADDDLPVKTVVPRQEAGAEGRYQYRVEVSQEIPDRVDGHSVEFVTVLEQYTSYFLQRELDRDDDAVIWTPACAPLTWGWSIRVGRRIDGPWAIVRRKVMLPIHGHEGLELPVWERDTLGGPG